MATGMTDAATTALRHLERGRIELPADSAPARRSRPMAAIAATTNGMKWRTLTNWNDWAKGSTRRSGPTRDAKTSIAGRANNSASRKR
jgi:hypothetical protein